jgi:uncharacterized protein YjbI with pentapeptide repeats
MAYMPKRNWSARNNEHDKGAAPTMKKVKKAQTEPPKLPVDLPELELNFELIQNHDHFESGIVHDCIIEGLQASKVSVDRVLFHNVTFTETSLRAVELTDVLFEKCDLSNVSFHDAAIHRTEFRNCKMIGFDLTGATLRNVRFHQCLGDYATFRFTNLKQCILENCSLQSADFYSSTLNKVQLWSSNIDKAEFTSTKLEGMDLSNCEFTGLGVGIDELQGCIISRGQASIFAELFGLVIKE